MLIRLDWNGLLSEVTNGSGFVVEYWYDIMDRVTNISWRTTSGAAIGGFGYKYAAAGRIVSHWQYDAWGNVVDQEIAPSAPVLATLRWVKKFGMSKFNGNFVTPTRHAQHDPFRHYNKTVKFPAAIRQLDRVPRVHYGTLSGCVAGVSSVSESSQYDKD